MKKIGVIGGGVIGLSCAVKLQQSGCAVTLFEERDDRQAASWGNAGHIATEQVAPLASPNSLRSVYRRLFLCGGPLDLPLSMAGAWMPFAMRLAGASTSARFAVGTLALKSLLIDAMPAWQRLAGVIDAPDLVRTEGHYIVWENAESARKGRSGWLGSDTGAARCADASIADIERLARVTSRPIAGAMRFEGSGQIADLARLANRLESAFASAGGVMVRTLASLQMIGDVAQVAGHRLDDIIVAAGVRSGTLMAALGHPTPIIAERGYHIRASSHAWPDDLPPVVFEDRSMIVTRFADCVQAASFVELGSVEGRPDPIKWQRLERHVAELRLPLSSPFTRWMGARPTLPDYLPAIGRSTRAANLFYAFGHQHLGLTLAPVTAEIMAAMLTGQASPVDLAPFDLARFDRRRRT